MKIKFFAVVVLFCLIGACRPGIKEGRGGSLSEGSKIVMDKSVLQDKIKGGWAGQVIGCSYGGPTEFQWLGSMVNDQVPIPWDENQIEMWYDKFPGLYDDIYMDLTFVGVFEKYGMAAPVEKHARAFANAGYSLWHANQAARYNILTGIMPPESGHYFNNPHSDDIDFQIESDFAGLMSPGMINASTAICDKIGHIMNYGDGWYGGVFVAGMYTQAFVSDDVHFIVTEALKAIPPESRFYQVIADVVGWHQDYPHDWKRCWFEIQRKWSFEKGCPDGVFKAFNIDAKLNAAYIVLGLLYGEGDFGKTVDISTRAGQDSDCNPSNAAGIIGTMLGYSNIPSYWLQGLEKVEDRKFSYTDLSLNDVYQTGFEHAVKTIELNGGKDMAGSVEIIYQKVVPVRLEQCFEGLYPKKRILHQWPFEGKWIDKSNDSYLVEFEGAGVVISGYVSKTTGELPDHDLKVDVFVNGRMDETITLPTRMAARKTEVYWNYELQDGKNEIKLVARDVPEGYRININSVLIYSAEKN